MAAWPHWIIVAIFAPLLGGVLTPAVSLRSRHVAKWWALAMMTIASCAAYMLAVRVSAEGPFSYEAGGWKPPYGIELRFDEYSVVIAVICLIGWFAVLYSFRYTEWLRALAKERVPYYYALLLLNIGGMIGLCVTGDLFNLYVFLEILSLSAYALVAISGEPLAAMAAFKYLLMGVISSLIVLMAIGFLLAYTGSLNMADVSARLALPAEQAPAALALGAFAVGFMVKAAIFPVHIWLPDAHAIAPSPISAVLSGLVVKIGIIGQLRVYQIYYGSGVFAIFQEDIKLMLAYSTISNVGYIVMGFGLATENAVMGGAVHVLNHALIKATLFLAAGAFIYETGYRTLYDLRGVGRTMPMTGAAMVLGALSIVGIPPTVGFLCKWYIALGAFDAGQASFGFALVFGALFIFIYYVRMLNALYFQTPVNDKVRNAKDPPPSMLVPIIVLAALCLIMGVGGLGNVPLDFIEPATLRMLGAVGG